MLSRESMLAAVRGAVEPLPFVHAMWEGGSAAFGRDDDRSDLDLCVVADDDRVEDVYPVVRAALEALSPIEVEWRIPDPTWHGNTQAFWKLRDADPHWLVDLCVMKRSAKRKFLTVERHGEAVVHFDRIGFVQPTPLDREAHDAKLRARLARNRMSFALFEPMAIKQLDRGREIDAMTVYLQWPLRVLVDLLRMKHDPARYDFGPEYLYNDIPEKEAHRVRDLYFVADAADLRRKHAEACAWVRELLEELNDA